MNKEELKNIFTKNRDKGFGLLEGLIDSNDEKYNDFLLLKKQHYEGEINVRRGILSQENWNVLDNKILLSILSFIDNLSSQSTNSDNINSTKEIEKSISWITNSIIGVKYSGEKEDKEDKSKKCVLKESKTVKGLKIELDGSFKLVIEENIRHDIYSRYNNSLKQWSTVDQVYEFTGNFKDIGNIEIWRPDEDEDMIDEEIPYTTIYPPMSIIANSIDEEKLFYLKLNGETKRWLSDDDEIYKEFHKERHSNEDQIEIDIDNIGLAKRIESCLKYLTVYFKNQPSSF